MIAIMRISPKVAKTFFLLCYYEDNIHVIFGFRLHFTSLLANAIVLHFFLLTF